MKMTITAFKTSEVWDVDSTDFEETDCDDSPNKIYLGSSSSKMQNNSLKDKGYIKEDEKEKFIEDINVTLWRNKRIRSVQFHSH